MKNKKKVRRTQSVIIIFSLLVFGILSATMLVVGGAIYIMFRRDVFTMSSIETLSMLITFFLFASIIIGTLIGILTGRVVLKNIDLIVDGMDELAQGNYDVRVPELKSGITKELTDTFNVLASELENTNTLRSDFINDFAHEFKTPIVSLLGFAKLLKNKDLTEKQYLEYLEIIEEEAQRLSTLSTNSLNLTKIDKQEILTNVVTYNLSEQIRNCVLLTEKKWTKKNLEPVLDFDEYYISANEEMLKQVWINLIDNAIKFSFADEKIEINIFKDSQTVRVVVKNKGVEIKEGEREKIFGRFYRTESAEGIEGTGVGLAVVKKIIDLHKGQIYVQSNDGVTQFEVVIPCRKI